MITRLDIHRQTDGCMKHIIMHMYRQMDKQAYRLIIRNMFVYHVCILCLKHLNGLHNLVDYLWLNELFVVQTS